MYSQRIKNGIKLKPKDLLKHGWTSTAITTEWIMPWCTVLWLWWTLGIFIIAVNYSQASPSELCYLINCSVIGTQSCKQCQYKLKTAAQWLVSFMHCTLMPHKSYYGDIYCLGLGSYWYVKTINITLTCAKLSKPVGPWVSLSNSYSRHRIITHHLCSDREL